MRERLLACQHWIFDLDGTLTKPIFDFPAIKRRLGLPPDRGILEVMAEMEPTAAATIAEELDAIEYELAGRAEGANGAQAFLAALKARGARLGILTRNKKSHALLTLRVTGMAEYFDEIDILGRDEASHKPSPEGIHKLLSAWQVEPQEAVMVGDFLFDLQAGAAAGTYRLYVDAHGSFPHRAHADLSVRTLDELLALDEAMRP